MLIGPSLALVGSSCEQPAEATRAQSITGSRWGKRITASEEATFCRGNRARREGDRPKRVRLRRKARQIELFPYTGRGSVTSLYGAPGAAVPRVCEVGPAVDGGTRGQLRRSNQAARPSACWGERSQARSPRSSKSCRAFNTWRSPFNCETICLGVAPVSV